DLSYCGSCLDKHPSTTRPFRIPGRPFILVWDVGSGLGHRWKREALRVDFHPVALDLETAFREEADREGKEDVFLFQDARGEGLLRIILVNRDGLLEDDRSSVDRGVGEMEQEQDRKSTRLNSSHVAISYAVFCLKKKNKTVTV